MTRSKCEKNVNYRDISSVVLTNVNDCEGVGVVKDEVSEEIKDEIEAVGRTLRTVNG